MNLDIGTHIFYKDERGEILNFNPDNTRCLILLYECKTVSGMTFKTWVQTDDLKIDLQFYRNEKINNITSNNNS
jgi:hypothetical protein